MKTKKPQTKNNKMKEGVIKMGRTAGGKKRNLFVLIFSIIFITALCLMPTHAFADGEGEGMDRDFTWVGASYGSWYESCNWEEYSAGQCSNRPGDSGSGASLGGIEVARIHGDNHVALDSSGEGADISELNVTDQAGVVEIQSFNHLDIVRGIHLEGTILVSGGNLYITGVTEMGDYRTGTLTFNSGYINYDPTANYDFDTINISDTYALPSYQFQANTLNIDPGAGNTVTTTEGFVEIPDSTMNLKSGTFDVGGDEIYKTGTTIVNIDGGDLTNYSMATLSELNVNSDHTLGGAVTTEILDIGAGATLTQNGTFLNATTAITGAGTLQYNGGSLDYDNGMNIGTFNVNTSHVQDGAITAGAVNIASGVSLDQNGQTLDVQGGAINTVKQGNLEYDGGTLSFANANLDTLTVNSSYWLAGDVNANDLIVTAGKVNTNNKNVDISGDINPDENKAGELVYIGDTDDKLNFTDAYLNTLRARSNLALPGDVHTNSVTIDAGVVLNQNGKTLDVSSNINTVKQGSLTVTASDTLNFANANLHTLNMDDGGSLSGNVEANWMNIAADQTVTQSNKTLNITYDINTVGTQQGTLRYRGGALGFRNAYLDTLNVGRNLTLSSTPGDIEANSVVILSGYKLITHNNKNLNVSGDINTSRVGELFYSGGGIDFNKAMLDHLQVSGDSNNLLLPGEVDVNDISLFGGASITQSGQPVTVNNNMHIYKGVYDLNGGTLTVKGGIVNNSGAGKLYINGGTLHLDGGEVDVDRLHFNSGVLSGVGTIANSDITVGAGAVLSPGSSPGEIVVDNGVMTWASGGSMTWEITDVMGLAGTDWDLITLINGADLNITATAENPFTINMVELGNSGFDPLAEYSWLVVDDTSGNTIMGNFDGVVLATNGIDFGGLGGPDFTLEVDANEIIIARSAVPELPTAALPILFGGLLGGLVFLRKKLVKVR